MEQEKAPRVKFLHSPQFNSEPEFLKNDWHKISGIEDIEKDDDKILWAWPVKENEVEEFLDDNAYCDTGETTWEEIDPTGKFAYAIPYEEFKKWLLDEGELPFLEPFDSKKHSMNKKYILTETHPVGYFDENGRRTKVMI